MALDNVITTAEATGTSLLPVADLSPSTPAQGRFDYMIRISGQEMSGSMNVDFAMTRTARFISSIARTWKEQMSREMATLVDVIRWQHAVLDYNSQYNAFLLEQITQDEFETISNRLAYTPSEIEPKDLAAKIVTIIGMTGIDYTATDFASLFRCTKESVDKALKSLGIG